MLSFFKRINVELNLSAIQVNQISVKLKLRKYRTIASAAATVGFVLGTLLPVLAFAVGRWSCPFGDGVLRIGVFVLLTGVLGGVLVGNAAAVVLILVAKCRQSLKQ